MAKRQIRHSEPAEVEYPADPAGETYLSPEQIRRHEIFAAQALDAKSKGQRARYGAIMDEWNSVTGGVTNTNARVMRVGVEAEPWGQGADVAAPAKRKPGGETRKVLKLIVAGKSNDDITAATDKSVEAVRRIRSDYNLGAFDLSFLKS